jgi:hypothetical protein
MFAAYLGSNQSISAGVTTKVEIDTEDLDITGVYDAVTDFRFLPTTAGTYMATGGISAGNNSTAINEVIVSIRKNGTQFVTSGNTTPTDNDTASGSIAYPIQLNGITDYLELFVWMNGNNTLTGGSSRQNFFSAHLIAPEI